MSVDEKIDTAISLQQEDMRLLDEATAIVEQTKDIGMNTIEKLSEQNEQLDSALDDVNKINSDLDVAAKVIRVISKNIMTDKIIKGAMFACIFVFLVAIILLIIKPHSKETIEEFEKKNTTKAVLVPPFF